MIGDAGIYLIYRCFPDPNGRVERRLVGKFLMTGGRIKILEDHDGLLDDVFSSGQFDDRAYRALCRLQRSPYWQLVEVNDPPDSDIKDLKLAPTPWKAPPEEPQR